MQMRIYFILALVFCIRADGAAPIPATIGATNVTTVEQTVEGVSHGTDRGSIATDLLTLEEGESWVYAFSDLTYVGTVLGPGFTFSLFTLSFLNDSLSPNTILQWEAFAGPDTNVLVNSGLLSNLIPVVTVMDPGLDLDRDGAVRLTALSGLVVVSNITVEYQHQNIGGTRDIYRNTFNPLEVPAPVIITQFISNVGFQEGTVNVVVNPENLPTTLFVEWGSTTNYGTTTEPMMLTGHDPVSRQITISNLAFATEYHLRGVSSNNAGVAYGANLSFTTLPPCTVTAQAPLNIAATSARLAASVTANGFDTSIYFEWGLTTNYGSATPVLNIGNPLAMTNVFALVTGLSPATAYHYRAVAFAMGVTNWSENISFEAFEPPSTVITNLISQDVRGVLEVGGRVRFDCDGVIPVVETIEIRNYTSIDATGRDITFSGGNAARIFKVFPDITFALTNVGLTGGLSSAGSAIYNEEGTVHAHRCRFIANSALGMSGADGLNGTNGTSGNVSLDLTTAGGNGTDGMHAEDGLGGAVFSSGALRLVACLFQENSAIGGHGGKGGNGGKGGTYFRSGAPAGGRDGGNGGIPGNAGHGKGGALYTSGLASLQDCMFSNNQAVGGTGGSGGGGGYTGDIFGSSTAAAGSAAPGAEGGLGIGAAVFASGQCLLSNSLVIFKGVAGGTGGVGGGITNFWGAARPPFPREGGIGGAGLGGAIGVYGDASIINCTSVSNSAAGGTGGGGGVHPWGGIARTGNGGDGLGGFIFHGGSGLIGNVTLYNDSSVAGISPGGTNGLSYGSLVANNRSVPQAKFVVNLRIISGESR
jgi:hypothetical protein